MIRRSFLRSGVASLFGVLGAGILHMRCDKEKKTGPSGPGDPDNPFVIDLNDEANAALRQVGGAKKVQVPGVSGPLVVIRISTDRVNALSSRCTHAGCEVGLPTNQEIVCPCHGSKFDPEGAVILGPATQPLPTYPAVIQNQTISITVD